MKALDVFLLPGKTVLGGLLSVFQLDWAQQEPLLFAIAAGFISWLIWIVVLKTIWFITLRLLGFA